LPVRNGRVLDFLIQMNTDGLVESVKCEYGKLNFDNEECVMESWAKQLNDFCSRNEAL
jgi:hypothetical protein